MISDSFAQKERVCCFSMVREVYQLKRESVCVFVHEAMCVCVKTGDPEYQPK